MCEPHVDDGLSNSNSCNVSALASTACFGTSFWLKHICSDVRPVRISTCVPILATAVR